MKKKYEHSERKGLPGGPNEVFSYVTGVFSEDGYKSYSSDVNNPFNIINSGRITMEDVEFPVMGIDDLGNSEIMMPDGEYEFPGDIVFEIPIAKSGGNVSWNFKGKTYSGTLIPSMEDENNRYARTHNGKIKTLPKAQLGKLLKYFTPSPSQAKSVPKKITTYSHLGEQVPPKGIENFDNVFYRNTPVDDSNILDDLAFKSGEAPDNLSFFTPSKKEYSDFGPVKYSAEINPTNPYLNKYRGKYWHSDEIKNLMDQGYDAIVTNKFEIPDWYGRLDKAHEIIPLDKSLIKNVKKINPVLSNEMKVNKNLLETGMNKTLKDFKDENITLKILDDATMSSRYPQVADNSLLMDVFINDAKTGRISLKNRASDINAGDLDIGFIKGGDFPFGLDQTTDAYKMYGKRGISQTINDAIAKNLGLQGLNLYTGMTGSPSNIARNTKLLEKGLLQETTNPRLFKLNYKKGGDIEEAQLGKLLKYGFKTPTPKSKLIIPTRSYDDIARKIKPLSQQLKQERPAQGFLHMIANEVYPDINIGKLVEGMEQRVGSFLDGSKKLNEPIKLYDGNTRFWLGEQRGENWDDWYRSFQNERPQLFPEIKKYNLKLGTDPDTRKLEWLNPDGSLYKEPSLRKEGGYIEEAQLGKLISQGYKGLKNYVLPVSTKIGDDLYLTVPPKLDAFKSKGFGDIVGAVTKSPKAPVISDLVRNLNRYGEGKIDIKTPINIPNPSPKNYMILQKYIDGDGVVYDNTFGIPNAFFDSPIDAGRGFNALQGLMKKGDMLYGQGSGSLSTDSFKNFIKRGKGKDFDLAFEYDMDRLIPINTMGRDMNYKFDPSKGLPFKPELAKNQPRWTIEGENYFKEDQAQYWRKKLDDLIISTGNEPGVGIMDTKDLGKNVQGLKKLYAPTPYLIKKQEGGQPMTRAERIYNLIPPTGYTDIGNMINYFKVDSDSPVPVRTEMTDPRGEEMYKQYLGLNTTPKYLRPSLSKPSIAKDKNVQYYQLDPELEKSIFGAVGKSLKVGDIKQMSELDLPERFNVDDNYGGYNMWSGLGNFTVSKGVDDEGREYISYYDKYDLPDYIQDRLQGQPYEVYGRINPNAVRELEGDEIKRAKEYDAKYGEGAYREKFLEEINPKHLTKDPDPLASMMAYRKAMEEDKKQKGGEFQKSGINLEGLKKGIAAAESLSGELMMNPQSTATGLYGQRFSEIESLPELKGISREKFSKDTELQNKIFDKRFYEGIGAPSLERNANELYDEYSKQIENFDFSKEDIAALSNFLGRQGTRNYLGLVIRDKKELSEALPNVYGDTTVANKTPEEYLKIIRPFYKQKGGEKSDIEMYKGYIYGEYDGTDMEKEAEKIYNKLNRVYRNDAKAVGMTIPNYIMTNVFSNVNN